MPILLVWVAEFENHCVRGGGGEPLGKIICGSCLFKFYFIKMTLLWKNANIHKSRDVYNKPSCPYHLASTYTNSCPILCPWMPPECVPSLPTAKSTGPSPVSGLLPVLRRAHIFGVQQRGEMTKQAVFEELGQASLGSPLSPSNIHPHHG